MAGRSNAGRLPFAILVAWAASGSVGRAGTTYNLVGGFSLASNPVGPWTYLAGSALEPTKTKAFAGVQNWFAWTTNQPIPNSATLARNKTGNQINNETIAAPTNVLLMDPEGLADVAVRFTAPSAGTYLIKGRFTGIDTNEHTHPVAIEHNGAAAFSGSISSYGQKMLFKLSLSLAAGDTVDFMCETGSSYSYLSTGLMATITAP